MLWVAFGGVFPQWVKQVSGCVRNRCSHALAVQLIELQPHWHWWLQGSSSSMGTRTSPVTQEHPSVPSDNLSSDLAVLFLHLSNTTCSPLFPDRIQSRGCSCRGLKYRVLANSSSCGWFQLRSTQPAELFNQQWIGQDESVFQAFPWDFFFFLWMSCSCLCLDQAHTLSTAPAPEV